jgi:hypothetical protein
MWTQSGLILVSIAIVQVNLQEVKIREEAMEQGHSIRTGLKWYFEIYLG